jgi:hypothetical protein
MWMCSEVNGHVLFACSWDMWLILTRSQYSVYLHNQQSYVPPRLPATPICRSPLWVPELPLGLLGNCSGIYFVAITSPDISNSTYTTGFTFNRKLLGSLIPHFTYGTSNLLVPFQ